jgi:hypothetical protein
VRRDVLAFVLTVAVSGVAMAGVLTGAGSPSAGPPTRHDKAEANEQDAGAHGGPIERFHQAGSCDLTTVSSLPGNWKHGDYVSAVAAGGNPAQIRQAARSDCGKPMVALGHGGGPPAHALEHMAAGQAHAGGEPPAHAVEHMAAGQAHAGGGPPAHAVEHMAAGQAHAGGEPDDAGSDATGS